MKKVSVILSAIGLALLLGGSAIAADIEVRTVTPGTELRTVAPGSSEVRVETRIRRGGAVAGPVSTFDMREFQDLPWQQQMIVNTFTEDQKRDFAGFSREERSVFLQLPAERRAFFFSLDPAERQVFISLSPKYRQMFWTLGPAERSFLVGLTQAERVAFFELNPADRTVYITLRPEERAQFIYRESGTIDADRGAPGSYNYIEKRTYRNYGTPQQKTYEYREYGVGR